METINKYTNMFDCILKCWALYHVSHIITTLYEMHPASLYLFHRLQGQRTCRKYGRSKKF